MMAIYYLDTSALVKRYVSERGSDWIRSITDPSGNEAVVLSELALVEVSAALAAKQRAPGGLTLEERDRALSRFLQDCAEFFVLLQVERDLIDLAVALTQDHRLRGYDAMHLATALSINDDLVHAATAPLVFVASDYDLLAAAQSEALSTIDPTELTEANRSALD